MSETEVQPAKAAVKAPRGKAARTGTGTRLVIVESPARAKKIAVSTARVTVQVPRAMDWRQGWGSRADR